MVSSPKRIFCYGDSLTAGSSPPLDPLFPYGPHLEQELNQSLQSSALSSSSSSSSSESESGVVVRWRGLPGWTASAMVEYMNDSTIGLRSALDAIRNPSISIVIILAGTNDIGSITSSMFDSRNSDLDESNNNNMESVKLVMDPIVRLHKTCLDCIGDSGRKDMQTLAVGIPGSAWQERNSNAAQLCADVNDALRQFAASEERVTYTDFPFLYQSDDIKWSSDGLHLSPEGYETLGKCLAQSVKEMCMEK
eukprot:CAMPEP_0176480818 /NCGR_PEP_ID=MMETSP0200_2-20121128/2482_1 /TAXON_ID=947934 /ORGANISM="Chaetoceros sp., Strain GSL56" /LENGTH=249 /DNA_ID=CAMNT_0017876967 /DNA_START=159 /DNA_END=908 /DNA_ORIENTATION=-